MNVTKMTRRYARSRELVARLRLGVRLEGAIERTGVDLLRLRRNANAIRRIGKQLMQGAARSRLSARAAEECFGEHGAYVPTRSVLSLVLNVNRDSSVIVLPKEAGDMAKKVVIGDMVNIPHVGGPLKVKRLSEDGTSAAIDTGRPEPEWYFVDRLQLLDLGN